MTDTNQTPATGESSQTTAVGDSTRSAAVEAADFSTLCRQRRTNETLRVPLGQAWMQTLAHWREHRPDELRQLRETILSDDGPDSHSQIVSEHLPRDDSAHPYMPSVLIDATVPASLAMSAMAFARDLEQAIEHAVDG